MDGLISAVFTPADEDGSLNLDQVPADDDRAAQDARDLFQLVVEYLTTLGLLPQSTFWTCVR